MAGVEQHFRGRNALAIGFLDQALGDDGAQADREVQVEGRPVFQREEADDAVERMVAVVGVQGGEAEVAGLGVGEMAACMVSLSRISPIRDAVRAPGAWRSSARCASPPYPCRFRAG